MNNLRGIILKLIELRKEGDYWDFKLQHHSNPVDLVHDILCLANNIHAKGNRFLIFGIEPVSYEIKGLNDTEANRQANIVDTLNQAHFAGGLYPDVHLHKLEIDGKRIEVLQIKDSEDKPFYLEKGYDKNGKKLNAGTVYSRIRDRNTSKNGVAISADIEKMWRQRFGLDVSPSGKFYRYLEDHRSWESVDGRSWYYKLFPEFSIELSEESNAVGEHNDCWVRAAINPSAYYTEIVLKYHQTILWKGLSVTIDGARARLMVPSSVVVNGATGINMDVFYAYCVDSMDYRLNNFLIKNRGQHAEYSIEACMKPILLFETEGEKEAFMDYVRTDPAEIERQLYDGGYDQYESEIAKKDLIYSTKVKLLYAEWRAGAGY